MAGQLKTSLFRIIDEILNGYIRFFRGTGVSLVQILALCAASFLIVFPLWYLATNFRAAYNILFLVLISALLVFAIGKKIVKGIGREINLPMIIRFIALVCMLYVIRILLFENNLFYQAAGFLLFAGFFFFLCMTKGKTRLLIPKMHTLLIILASLLLFYSVSVLYVRKQYLFLIPVIVMYLCSIGYLLNRPGMKNGKKFRKI